MPRLTPCPNCNDKELLERHANGTRKRYQPPINFIYRCYYRVKGKLIECGEFCPICKQYKVIEEGEP